MSNDMSNIQEIISWCEQELAELESIPESSRSIMQKTRIRLARTALRDAKQEIDRIHWCPDCMQDKHL